MSAADALPKYAADGGPPPPYMTALKDAIVELEKKLKEDPEKTAAAIAESLGDKSSDQAFVQDISQLSTTIKTLERAFQDVWTNLIKFDATNQPDMSGNVTKFAPIWKPILDKFGVALVDSRRVAGTIATRVEMYFSTILPMLEKKDVTNEEKMTNLDFYLGVHPDGGDYNEELKKDEKAAQAMAQAFKNIELEVSGFRASFNAYWKSVGDKLDADIESLNADIKQLEKEVGAFKQGAEVAAKVAAGGAVVGGVGAVMVATGFLAPVGFVLGALGGLAALGGGIAALVEVHKAAQKQRELDGKRSQLTQKLKQKEDNSGANKELVRVLNEDMETICAKLVIIHSVWGYIRSQAQEQREHVQTALNSKAPVIFKKGAINLATNANKRLYTCVKLYADGYDAAKPPKSSS